MSLALLAILATSSADTVEVQIRASYTKWDSCYMVNDVKSLAGMLHKSFKLVTDEGKTVSRRDYVARMWKAPLPETYETKVLKVAEKGVTVYVWTKEKSRYAGDKAVEHLYRDSWLLESGRWMLTESRTTGGH